MDPNADVLWQLETVREVLSLAADEVSLSFFTWQRAPGNGYFSFYPTSWLRDERQGADHDRSFGSRIFHGVVSPAEGPRVATLATYGDGALRIPAWTDPRPPRSSPVAERRRQRTPARAAKRILAELDLRWLASLGDVDAESTAAVLAWMDRVVEVARDLDAHGFGMDFDEEGSEASLRRITLYGPKRSETVSWPSPDA